MEDINGKGKVTHNGTFIFPKDDTLTYNDLEAFIDYNENHLVPKFRNNMDLYLGEHPILDIPDKETGDTNRIVVNMPKYVVDTYNGFFMGIPPKISLESDNLNDTLQQWNNRESIYDKLNEISKQTDIDGRSIGFVYQDEDGNTRLAYSSPNHAFIIYDDTVQREPLAFVYYHQDESSNYYGDLVYSDYRYTFHNNKIDEDDVEPNIYKMVPAVEFFENEERTGVFDSAVTLINELDSAISQKSDEVAYFANAYLVIQGVQFETDPNTGKPKINIQNNRLLYFPNVDPNAADPKVEFVSKPDNDAMQEHLIDRIQNAIFQMCMVPNLNDEAFSGNSSGVALDFKLLPMRNKASSKERKFTQALRKLYRIIFTQLLPDSNSEAWQDLQFVFTRNLPINLADEATTAKTLEGVVSKKTQLKVLNGIVADPEAEIKQIADEQDDQIKRTAKAADSLPDFMKSDEGVNNGEQEE